MGLSKYRGCSLNVTAAMGYCTSVVVELFGGGFRR
jgi:hypothetical protein